MTDSSRDRRGARVQALLAALVVAAALVAAPVPAAAAPQQDGPVWTQPQGLAPSHLQPDFPTAVAVGQGGRVLAVFGCNRGRGATARRALCARWREWDGRMGPTLTLGDAASGAAEDAPVDAAISTEGIATVVWETAAGLQLRRVRAGGRLGGEQLLATGRVETVAVTAGDAGSVAVTWAHDQARSDPAPVTDGVRVRVVSARGVAGPTTVLPGNTVHRVVPVPGGGDLGYAVLTSDAGLTRSVARYDLTEVAEDGTVRATTVVDDATVGVDVATRHTGALVLAWWRSEGDERVLTVRRYPQGLAGPSRTFRAGPVHPRGGEAVLATTFDGLQLVFSTERGRRVGVVPWSGGKPLRHVPLAAGGEVHAARDRLVLLHPVASVVGQYVEVRTWDGTRLSRPKRVLVDDRFDNECGDSRFDIASAHGHVAVVNVRELGCVRSGLVRAQVVVRD